MTKKLLSREQELRNEYRYGFFSCPIYYKANLWIHTARISWITREIATFLDSLRPNSFDIEKTVALSIVHDDTEIIVGDIVSPVKMAFTPEEKKAYEDKCTWAIDILYAKYWKDFTDYDYKQLLLMEEAGTSIEYAIMKYADKLEAHLEVYHELLAWNKAFDDECAENFWIDAYDFSYSSSMTYLQKLLDILWLTQSDISWHPILDISKKFSSEEVLAKSNGFHTKESIEKKTGFPVYDARIWLHFQYGHAEQLAYLYERVE